MRVWRTQTLTEPALYQGQKHKEPEGQMAKKKDPLEGKAVAIVGLGGTYADYILARINSQKFDEVWGINSIGAIVRVDRTFMMDPASRFLDDVKAGTQTGIGQEFLLDTPNKGPIYSCVLDDRVPEIVEYPLADVISDLQISYFNNTVAYALGFAIHKKVAKIHLYGIDFSYKQNLNFAEAGRACCEFWCAIAISRGIKIEVAHKSGFLDTNVPENEKLYGYHRLENPLVQRIVDGDLMIVRQNDLSPPEPVEHQDPVLIGRHDIPNVTYVEKEGKNVKRQN